MCRHLAQRGCLHCLEPTVAKHQAAGRQGLQAPERGRMHPGNFQKEIRQVLLSPVFLSMMTCGPENSFMWEIVRYIVGCLGLSLHPSPNIKNASGPCQVSPGAQSQWIEGPWPSLTSRKQVAAVKALASLSGMCRSNPSFAILAKYLLLETQLSHLELGLVGVPASEDRHEDVA